MADDNVLICGLPERMEVRGPAARWPETKISWAWQGSLPHLGPADCKQATELAWGFLAAVCGVEPFYSANAKTAHILLTVANLGGPQGVLADSELVPAGLHKNSEFQANQRYDTSERWAIAENPKANEIDLVRVVCHELMHALGIGHGGDGLIAPTYSRKIRRPQPGFDTEQLVSRYGLPKPVQPPTPTPGQSRLSCHFEWDAISGKLLSGAATGARVTILGG